MMDDNCLGLWRERYSNEKFSMLKHHQRNKRKREAESDESCDCVDDFAGPCHAPPPGKRQSMGRRSRNVPHLKEDPSTGASGFRVYLVNRRGRTYAVGNFLLQTIAQRSTRGLLRNFC